MTCVRSRSRASCRVRTTPAPQMAAWTASRRSGIGSDGSVIGLISMRIEYYTLRRDSRNALWFFFLRYSSASTARSTARGIVGRFPVSHRDTVFAETPRASASCGCVRPRPSRRCLNSLRSIDANIHQVESGVQDPHEQHFFLRLLTLYLT